MKSALDRSSKTTIQIAACILYIEDCFLLLQYASPKPDAGKWGIPSGKIEKKESPKEAARRELFEETGIQAKDSSIKGFGCMYIPEEDTNYDCHLFAIHLEAKPEIQLSEEHACYVWAKIETLKNLQLMKGTREVLEYYLTKNKFLS